MQRSTNAPQIPVAGSRVPLFDLRATVVVVVAVVLVCAAIVAAGIWPLACAVVGIVVYAALATIEMWGR